MFIGFGPPITETNAKNDPPRTLHGGGKRGFAVDGDAAGGAGSAANGRHSLHSRPVSMSKSRAERYASQKRTTTTCRSGCFACFTGLFSGVLATVASANSITGLQCVSARCAITGHRQSHLGTYYHARIGNRAELGGMDEMLELSSYQ